MNTLRRALIWNGNACFLELADDAVVDPDTAVEQMAQMSTILQRCFAEEKAAFARPCVDEAARLRKGGGARNAEVAEVITGLPESAHRVRRSRDLACDGLTIERRPISIVQANPRHERHRTFDGRANARP